MAEQVKLLTLSAETLGLLDRGRYKAVLETAFQRAVQDCIARPTDDRARKVTLQFDLVPVPEIDEQIVYCDGVQAKYQVKATVPNWESKPLDFGVRRDGSLVFNEEAPDNHRQMTLPIGEDQRES